MVLPPTVMGYALLVGMGPDSAPGRWYRAITDSDLVFSFNGIVVAACIASVPFYIWQAQVALSEVDRDLEDSARTEGAGEMGVFRFITVPLASRGIIAGVVLTFARALGDFGTTLMVGGNIPGMTHTLPLAVYDAWQADQHKIAQGASLLLASIALVISVSAARLTRKPVQWSRRCFFALSISSLAWTRRVGLVRSVRGVGAKGPAGRLPPERSSDSGPGLHWRP